MYSNYRIIVLQGIQCGDKSTDNTTDKSVFSCDTKSKNVQYMMTAMMINICSQIHNSFYKQIQPIFIQNN